MGFELGWTGLELGLGCLGIGQQGFGVWGIVEYYSVFIFVGLDWGIVEYYSVFMFVVIFNFRIVFNYSNS